MLTPPEKLFGDAAHIIYVNGSYDDTSTPLGELIHDFSCENPSDMLSQLKTRMTYLKTTDEGRTYMKKRTTSFAEECIAEGEVKGAMDEKRKIIAKMLSNGKAIEEIMEDCDCSAELVQEVANSTTSTAS